MSKKKIISVADTRPEFIKIAALSPHLSKLFAHSVVNTGQHYDWEMSKMFFQELSIKPSTFNLHIGSATHGKQVGQMLIGIEDILLREKPRLLIVYGDTNSTLAGALAAAKLNIPIAHVEAGMRSYDQKMPEEVNRIVVDHVSSLFLCASQDAVKNLVNEGINKNVSFTGDVVYDIFLQTKPDFSIIKKNIIQPKEYYFATIHRSYNTDNIKTFMQLLTSLESLNRPVVFPLHPRSKKVLRKSRLELKNIRFLTPVNFSQSLALQKQSLAVITDSGGIQKEAYWLSVPCFTLRNSTEWVETVRTGWNILVSSNPSRLQNSIDNFRVPEKHPQLYGDGNACSKIVKLIENYLREN